MRVMVIVKANEQSESGAVPTTDEMAEMGRFNEKLVEAGVLLAADGLTSSREGKRVRFGGKGKDTAVIDGPFAETKELIAGFWIWQVASMEEALEWARRAPFQEGAELEVRRVFEAEDFGENLTPELRQRENALRDKVAGTP